MINFAILLDSGSSNSKTSSDNYNNNYLDDYEEGTIDYPETGNSVESWHYIDSFEGNGIKNTETFTIPSNEWRISWDTRSGEYGDMNFQIFVYSEDGDLVGVAANVIGEDEDSSIMRGAGDYYLTINTAQPYEITIEAKY